MDLTNLEWQLHNANEWVFGEKVRGVVRKPYYAEIYYDEGQDPSWVWFSHIAEARGKCVCLDQAILEAEEVLQSGNFPTV